MGWSVPHAPEPENAPQWSPWICVFIMGAGYLAALAWVVFNSPASGLPPLSSGFYLLLTGYTLVGVLIFLSGYLLGWEIQATHYFNHRWWQHNTDRAWQQHAFQHLSVVKAVTLTADPALLSRLAGLRSSATTDDEESEKSANLLPGEEVTPGIYRFEQLCRALMEGITPSLNTLSAGQKVSVYLHASSEDENMLLAKLKALWPDFAPARIPEFNILPTTLPFSAWNDVIVTKRNPVLILAMHYRQPDETVTEMATALLLSPPGLLKPAERSVSPRLFRAMPVKISQFNAELIELRDMAQQPAESLRLVWFSGLAESARQKLSALVHELKLPLRASAPMGGVLDFDKGCGQYGPLTGWLLAGAATQMVELGQGSQWILCSNDNQTWAMVVGNQAPVLQTPAEDLPVEPYPAGSVTLALLFNIVLFWALGHAWPQWLFSGWGLTTVIVSMLVTFPGFVLALRWLVNRLQKPYFIKAANASVRD